VQVIADVAMRLRDLHEAGWAHRDLKPANVMYLPRENQWTLVDFGIVTRIGEDAALSYTL
jgi:serine/threonine protein kinase